MEDKEPTASTTDEIMKLRELLAQGLFLLELEYPERFGVLMALKTKEQIWEMLWWIRENLERKPSQKEIMDIFAVIAKPNAITLAALKEAKEDKNLKTINLYNLEEYIESL